MWIICWHFPGLGNLKTELLVKIKVKFLPKYSIVRLSTNVLKEDRNFQTGSDQHFVQSSVLSLTHE